MTPGLREQWSEFDWERELRKDDERVSSYFRELPDCIDLPGEDEMILRRIQRKKAPASRDAEWPFHALDGAENGADGEEDYDDGSPEAEEERRRWDEEWQKRDGAATYIHCGKIARELASLFAAAPEGTKAASALLKALCLTGKIMARTTDLIELEKDELPALRIALCKRLTADANQLLGILPETGGDTPEAQESVEIATGLVHEIREQLLDILVRTRNSPPPPSFLSGAEEEDGV